jgi:hypothetical protein
MLLLVQSYAPDEAPYINGSLYKLSGAVAKLASINLRKLVLSPTGSINLGFILREDLLLCSSYLPLRVPNWLVIYTPLEIFSELDETKLKVPIFPRHETESKEESEGGQGATTPPGGTGDPQGVPPYGVGALANL